jgi:hypothetical protein
LAARDGKSKDEASAERFPEAETVTRTGRIFRRTRTRTRVSPSPPHRGHEVEEEEWEEE